jgi:hypothetical protein
MHARGTGYAAALVGSDPIYTNTSWENVPVKKLDGGLKIPSGTWIDYQCDYTNAGSNDVFQGPKSTDEMCMLIGSYYPANRATSRCAPDDNAEVGNLGAEWVGNGAATCADTFACVQSAVQNPNPGEDGGFKAITACVLDSDPAVSREVSDAIRCLFMNFGDAQTACQTQFAACQAK